MTDPGRSEVERLLRSLAAVARLAEAFREPLHVAAREHGQLVPFATEVESGDLARLIEQVGAAWGPSNLRLFVARDPAELNTFEVIVSETLQLAPTWAGERLSGPVLESLPELVERVGGERAAVRFSQCTIAAADGAALDVYTLGDPSADPIVLIGACGMPVELSAPWLERLGERHFAITWETRGFSSVDDDFDAIGHDLDDQVADLFAVMDHCGVRRASVMGHCVGVVVALQAALAAPERVSSLILAHGNYGRSTCPRTEGEENFAHAMSWAGRSRTKAAQLRRVFLNPQAIVGIDREFGHLTLFPYASDELLYRYGRLCCGLLETDLWDRIDRVDQPALVLSGEKDVTAHPESSRQAGARLRRGKVHIEPQGEHRCLLTARSSLWQRVVQFLGPAAPAGKGQGKRPAKGEVKPWGNDAAV